jgi:hypothetical protein
MLAQSHIRRELGMVDIELYRMCCNDIGKVIQLKETIIRLYGENRPKFFDMDVWQSQFNYMANQIVSNSPVLEGVEHPIHSIPFQTANGLAWKKVILCRFVDDDWNYIIIGEGKEVE